MRRLFDFLIEIENRKNPCSPYIMQKKESWTFINVQLSLSVNSAFWPHRTDREEEKRDSKDRKTGLGPGENEKKKKKSHSAREEERENIARCSWYSRLIFTVPFAFAKPFRAVPLSCTAENKSRTWKKREEKNILHYMLGRKCSNVAMLHFIYVFFSALTEILRRRVTMRAKCNS